MEEEIYGAEILPVSLDEQDLKRMSDRYHLCERYHTGDTDACDPSDNTDRKVEGWNPEQELKTVYRRLFPEICARAVYKICIDCRRNAEFSYIPHERFAAAVITLGAGADAFLDRSCGQGRIYETYLADILCLELLNDAYRAFDDLLFERTGFRPGSYEFYGESYPLGQERELLELLRPDNVTLGESGMLQPLKSTAFIVPLEDGPAEERKNNRCGDCSSSGCMYRDKPEDEDG